MGSSSSKAVRKLPTASTLSRSSPASRAAPPPPPPHASVSDEPLEDNIPEGLDYGSVNRGGEAPTSSATSSQRIVSGARVSNEARGGAGRVQFTGEKDDAIRQDAMDPQFMRNLGQLGQVRIHDAGEFVPAQAQRTLLSRSPTYTSPAQQPPKHLHMPLLISLLDRLKTLPPGTDPSSIYAEYGMDQSTMSEVRKWVNSVSVSEVDDVRVEEGEEVREMKAVWVGGIER